MRNFPAFWSFALFSCAGQVEPPRITPPAEWPALDALLAPYDSSEEPGISVAVSIDGAMVYHRWVGLADLANDVPIDANTRFDIASVSKQFTAFAIMLLADEGKLSLEMDVRDVIPELHERPTPITIRHLLNHTSGLREVSSMLELTGRSPASLVAEPEALELIYRQRGHNFPAGERQEYSNTGYHLLAEIVARVSGESFPDFMVNRVFQPLGMDRTFVRSDPVRVIDDLALGYTPIGDGFAHDYSLAATFGASGIISTPRDLLRWARVFEASELEEFGGQRVLDAMAARSTLDDGRRLIGTNGQEYRRFRGFDTWSHGGTNGGFRSFLLRIPDARIDIAVLSNRADFLKAAFAFDVAEALLGDRLEPEAAVEFVPETGAALDRYVGDYRLFAGIVLSLRRDGDQLTFAEYGKDDAFALPQIGKGIFLLNPETELQLEFHDFADGHATEMRYQISDDGFIPAPRVVLEATLQAPLNVEELVGAFYCEALQQVITLSETNGQLILRTGTGVRTPLERYQPDTLRAAGLGKFSRIRIARDAQGRVSGLLVSALLADDLEYRKLNG